jgi:activator of HSP90 ATPase
MMTKAIQQKVEFAATPDELFEMYLDSKKHSESTGAKAKLSRKAGGKFSAWDGMLNGRNLLIVPGKTIVQSWRGSHWKNSDPDSILILQFSKTPRGGRVDLVHVNVPEHDHKGVTEGWHEYYWKPWKGYLAAKKKRK